MTIEQIVLLVLFLVFPLIQALRQALEKRSAPDMESAGADPDSGLPPDARRRAPSLVLEPAVPEWLRPAPVEPMPPVSRPPAPVVHAPVDLAQRPRPAASRARSQARGITLDRSGLRRAIVGMTVLGPPRSLAPYR